MPRFRTVHIGRSVRHTTHGRYGWPYVREGVQFCSPPLKAGTVCSGAGSRIVLGGPGIAPRRRLQLAPLRWGRFFGVCQYPVKSSDLPSFIASAATRLTPPRPDAPTGKVISSIAVSLLMCTGAGRNGWDKPRLVDRVAV
jgi:hypothetical protein